MKGLEKDFLQSIHAVEMITPKDVSLIENESLPTKYAHYCINLNGVEYQITVKKDEGCILILGKGGEEVAYHNARHTYHVSRHKILDTRL